MSELKFIYGATVHGIQEFIFQTNKLKEIAGASELVEQVCTRCFRESINIKENELKNSSNVIVAAAGNIKYVCKNEEQCKKLVLNFPKKIMEFAPGISISQAVVKTNSVDKQAIDKLGEKLRVQRNKPISDINLGLIAVKRARNTGLAAVEFKKADGKDDVYIDRATKVKIEQGKESTRIDKKFFGENMRMEVPKEMEDITGSKNKEYKWLAIIHADGNNMGMKIQQMAREISEKQNKIEEGESFVEKYREFSRRLDVATENAAQKAFKYIEEQEKIGDSRYYPCRPIVIGGDDLTIIIRADLALDFTKKYLEEFKRQSKFEFTGLKDGKNYDSTKDLKVDCLKEGLTACAGISFIKSNYPFHYGYKLAEELCGEAKNVAKKGLSADDLTPSCLMFHKVQDSFVVDYDQIKIRELTAGNYKFNYGPYYLDNKDNQPTIDDFQRKVEQLSGKKGNKIKSHFRRWLTYLKTDEELANQKLERIIANYSEIPKNDILDKEKRKTPVYDWLTILSINN